MTSAGLATDYTQMIRAAIALYSATAKPAYLDQGIAWFELLTNNYIDSGTIYLTPTDNSDLIIRPVAATDEAMPSGAGIMLQVAAHLFTLTGEGRYHQTAADILSAHAEQISRDIIGAASLQSGFDTILRSRLAYISSGRAGDDAGLGDLVLAEADPALIVLRDRADGTPPPKPVPAHDDGMAQLYLCEADRCRPPVTDLEEARMLLVQTRHSRKPG